MTQVKCRTMCSKGLSREAWKYLMRREATLEGISKRRDRIASQEEAEKKNITLPKLKWMEGKNGNV